MNFASMFETLTGHAPLRWQQRLYDEHFARGELPSAISVPTGLGKTGRFFAHEHDEVQPDMVVLGKGLGGGRQAAGVAPGGLQHGSFPCFFRHGLIPHAVQVLG